MNVRLRIGESEVVTDLSRPVSLALELDFGGAQPRHFGAPAATARPFAVPGFSGSVADGASCNCSVITVIPHCNGTHTECAGHLTREPLDAYRIVPAGLIPALLISVDPVAAASSQETADPLPQAADLLVTRHAIERRWLPTTPLAPLALIIRTASFAPADSPPYLTLEAVRLIVERGVQHLVIDLPSIDRDHDEGRLGAHRVFFGLDPDATTFAAVGRPQATITELARVPDTLRDGMYLLELQVPAWRGDAVPSRPLLYPFREA